MNKVIIFLIFLMFSSTIYSYQTFWTNGMCGGYADFQISDEDDEPWGDYWEAIIVEASKNAANYWNEAGSEHSLYYDGRGCDNPEIEYDDFWVLTSDMAYTYNWFWVLSNCAPTSFATIEVNRKAFSKDKNQRSRQMQDTITHEFGHLLGIAHSNGSNLFVDHTLEDRYKSILMRNDGYKTHRHLTEDDKFAARDLYGRDDQVLKTNLSMYKKTIVDVKGQTYWNSKNYKSYSKPQIAYQPNSKKRYTYIMTWVKSSTHQINYKFMDDYSKDMYDLGKAKDGTDENNLGVRHWINDSYTLSTPSIAVSDDGENAVIAWKQERANKEPYLADDIYYAIIPTSSHPSSDRDNPTGSIIFDNSGLSLGSFMAKTMTPPKVVWIEKWKRFVIFYTELNDSALWDWRIRYIVSDDEKGSFSASSNDRVLGKTSLFSNWNPLDVNCHQKKWDGKILEDACLLVFNPIKHSKNLVAPDSLAKMSFKVLEIENLASTNYIDESLYVIDPVLDPNFDWERKGYAHYTLPDPLLKIINDGAGNKIPANINTLNRIKKAAKQSVQNLKFFLYYDIYNNEWKLSNLEEENFDYNGFNMKSRTGFSMTLNKDKNRYRYLWIEE